MQISFELLHNDKEIVDLMMKEMVRKFNRVLPRIVNNISDKIRSATFNYLKSTDTYQSLIGGELAGHFGIPSSNREYIVDNIIKTLSDNMIIEYKPIIYSIGKFRHGINIRALRKDMSEVLVLPSSTIFSEKGTSLPWLEWLLLEGDKVIIKEYDVDFVYGKGRSGLAVMEELKGATWRVPAEYSGTITNNWLTNAITSPEYLLIIKEIIRKELNAN